MSIRLACLALLLLPAALHAQEPDDGGAVPEPSTAAQEATNPPVVDPAEAGYQAFLRQLRPRALAAGVTAATYDAVAAGLTFNRRVVSLDRAQPGVSSGGSFPAFAPYRARHVDANRVLRGRRAWLNVRPWLSRIEAETGVPEAMMVAIWGHETDYGGFSGSFDLARSLSSLAYDGRRRELFTDEFIDTLKLVDRGIPPAQLRGSWAGATGYPQFLPSVYLRLGRDGDGDGKADIWASGPDAVASIGNYLLNAGWKPNVRWGTEVIVPDGFDRAAVATRLVSPRCPRVFARHSRWLSVAEWKALGLSALGAWPADDEPAVLFEPDGPGRGAWLLTINYRAVLDYNCSNFYALSVGLLADAVQQ